MSSPFYFHSFSLIVPLLFHFFLLLGLSVHTSPSFSFLPSVVMFAYFFLAWIVTDIQFLTCITCRTRRVPMVTGRVWTGEFSPTHEDFLSFCYSHSDRLSSRSLSSRLCALETPTVLQFAASYSLLFDWFLADKVRKLLSSQLRNDAAPVIAAWGQLLRAPPRGATPEAFLLLSGCSGVRIPSRPHEVCTRLCKWWESVWNWGMNSVKSTIFCDVM
jgi:hypothetical protein